jgi:dCMP deaminase
VQTADKPCDHYSGNLCGGFGGSLTCDHCGWDRFQHHAKRATRLDELFGKYDLPTPKDTKWMQACFRLAPLFSTCAKRQYFSFVLAPDGSIAGGGYNGAPSGMQHCVDGGCPRFQRGSAPGSNYDDCVAVHAEENALLRSSPDRRKDGTLYVNGPPCFGCAKKITASGVVRVVIVDDPSYAQAKEGWEFMRRAGLEVAVLDPARFVLEEANQKMDSATLRERAKQGSAT